MFQFNSATALDEDMVARSSQQKSMLFEIAVAHAELVLLDENPDVARCIEIAIERQRRHFDARPPAPLSEDDERIVQQTSANLVHMLSDFAEQRSAEYITVRPSIAGFGWIGSGQGDFAIENTLVEVKNTDRNFIANDYRQVLLYWILSYAKAMESDEPLWTEYLLINPRLNRAAGGTFDSLISSASGGLSRIEVYEYLRTMVISSSEIRK